DLTKNTKKLASTKNNHTHDTGRHKRSQKNNNKNKTTKHTIEFSNNTQLIGNPATILHGTGTVNSLPLRVGPARVVMSQLLYALYLRSETG
ncbi:MAG TPA: hypothetical protein VKI00_21665, partial [Mycobacterium sp.]|uniref:hypothetical protein n=1 Tax=Mycobacterium sp. TaxID=1785 RepID=UPI002B74BC71